MRALIFAGKVVQLEQESFPVAPALEWIDLADINPKPEIGWLFDGAKFTAPPPRPPPPPIERLTVLALWAILKAKGVVSDADLS